MKTVIFLLGLSLFCMSCGGGSTTASLPELDLLSHGMPIKIKAPEGAVVEGEDLGIMQDVTVKGDNNYFLQITSGDLRVNDLAKKKSEVLAEAKKNPFFDEIVEENEAGFLFKKKISEEKTNYDFRHIKFQGSKEYLFQTGLFGTFSLEEVKRMYESVK